MALCEGEVSCYASPHAKTKTTVLLQSKASAVAVVVSVGPQLPATVAHLTVAKLVLLSLATAVDGKKHRNLLL